MTCTVWKTEFPVTSSVYEHIHIYKTHTLLGVKTYFCLINWKSQVKRSIWHTWSSDDNENKIMSFVVANFFSSIYTVLLEKSPRFPKNFWTSFCRYSLFFPALRHILLISKFCQFSNSWLHHLDLGKWDRFSARPLQVI